MRNRFSLIFILPLLITGCSSIYMPNVPNTPMLSSRGEIHGSAHISLKGNLSFNSALAVSDHVGVLLNGSYIDRNRDRKDFSQNLVEAAAGYFTTFGKQNERIFEVYAGYGRGSSERVYKDLQYEGSFPVETQNADFSKFFVQANYSAKNKKSLKLFGKRYPLNYGTALRINYLDLNKFTLSTTSGTSSPYKEDNIFLEPVFFTRMKVSETVQIQYTSGSIIGLKNRQYLTAGHSVFTLGAVINLGKK